MRQAPRSPLSFKLQRVANVPEHPPPSTRLMSCAHIANRQLSRIIGASFEEELAQDVIEIITVFSARLYGSRSHKTKQLLADLREEESKEEEVVTKSMPIPEGRVGARIESMQETQFKGMLLYAELLKKRK